MKHLNAIQQRTQIVYGNEGRKNSAWSLVTVIKLQLQPNKVMKKKARFAQ